MGISRLSTICWFYGNLSIFFEYNTKFHRHSAYNDRPFPGRRCAVIRLSLRTNFLYFGYYRLHTGWVFLIKTNILLFDPVGKNKV